MTEPVFLRHAARQVHQTVATYIEQGLGHLGWTSSFASERPFGAARVKVRRTAAVTGNQTSKLVNGTVAITLGNENAPDDLELGGPLTSQEYPIFVDVLMDEEALALTLATDIRDHLRGRFEFSQRTIEVIDQATQTPAAGWTLRFEDLERIRPDNVLTLHWQVVKVTATAEFNDVLTRSGVFIEDGGTPPDTFDTEDGGVE